MILIFIKDQAAMFGTDNLYFVPEGGRFVYYDLYLARSMALDVHAARVLAATAIGDEIKQSLSQALHEHFDSHSGITEEDRKKLISGMQAFYDAIQWTDGEAAYNAAHPLEALMAPLSSILWLRLSDGPLESFSAEDYIESKPGGDSTAGSKPSGADSQYYPLYGAIELEEVEQWELKIPGEPGAMPLFLQWDEPHSVVEITPLDPCEPLPIIEEYIGSEGQSAAGRIANYTLQGALAGENVAAVPLYCVAGRLFFTLYLHLTGEHEFDVTFNALPNRPETVNEKLKGFGFKPARHNGGYVVYEREGIGGMDNVHFYYDIEGRESLMCPTVRPFLWIAQAGGESDPAKRSKLIEEFIQLFKK